MRQTFFDFKGWERDISETACSVLEFYILGVVKFY